MKSSSENKSHFNPVSKPDFIPLVKLRELQVKRLKTIVKHAYEKVDLFRERMDSLKVKPGHIKSIDDISLLPFTEKTDLRDTYPFGLFASPMSDVVRIHASSGTTGKPVRPGW